MKKLLAVILMILLLLFVSGCEDTEAIHPTQIPTAEPTEPSIDPIQIYQDAVQQLLATSQMKIDAEVEKKVFVDSQIFEENSNFSLTYKDFNSDVFTSEASGVVNFGDVYSATFEEIWYEGKLYGKLNNYGYSAELTQDEYFRRFAPAVLLTPANYSSITLTNNIFGFSAATGFEDWVACDGFEFLEASGTAALNEQMQITSFTYSVSYLYGNVRYEIDYATTLSAVEDEISAPSKYVNWQEVGSADLPMMIERAYSYLLLSNQKSISTMRLAQSDAVAFSAAAQRDLILHKGDDLKMLNQEFTEVLNLSTGNIESFSMQETYSDGVLRYIGDDTAADPEEMDAAEIERFFTETVNFRFPELNTFEEIYISYVQGGCVFDYTLSEDVSEFLRLEVQEYLFGEKQFLDLESSGYELLMAEGYLAIDQYSGLPTANSITYSALHTIGGEKYQLTMQVTQIINAADRDAYTAITGEKLETTDVVEQPTPLFYKVTGQNGEQMWMLGTIHIGDDRTSNLPQEIYDALSASDALALEFDMHDFAEQLAEDPAMAESVLQEYLYTDGTTIADHLEIQDLYTAAVQTMKMTGQLQGTLLYAKPVIWSQILEEFYMRLGYELTAEDGVDVQLLSHAQDAEMEILSVESGLEQLKMLYGFSDEIQEAMLASTLSIDPVSYNAEQMELYELWCEGDEERLIAAMETDTTAMTQEELALYEEYITAMQTERNKQMHQVAEEYLESGETIFFAVGLAHLIGEDGLVQSLRNAGYSVEVVQYP